MATANEILLSNVNLSVYTMIEMPESVKNDILQKYDILAASKFNSNNELVVNNMDCYNILMNKTLFMTLMYNTQRMTINKFTNLNNMLRVLDTKVEPNKVNKELYKNLMAILINNGGAVLNNIGIDDINMGLSTFGLEIVDSTEDIEIEPDEIPDDLPDSAFDDIWDVEEDPEGWDDPEDTEDLEDLINDTSLDGEDAPENEETEFDIEDIDIEDSETATEEDSEAEQELIEKFKMVYGSDDFENTTPLRTAVDGIMKSFEELYASCYSGITFPDGVLTDKGILSLDKVQGTTQRRFVYNHSDDEKSIEWLKNKGNYGRYYNAVMYSMGVVAGGAAEVKRGMDVNARRACINKAVSIGESIFGKAIDGRKDTTPKYADACDANGREVIQFYPRFHTEFMTGNFTISKKMQDWAIENKAKRNQYRITRFEDIMKWARKRVSDCLTQACIDAGVKLEEVGSNDDIVNTVCQTMAKNIKNIIVITNMKKGFFTLKICNGKSINCKLFASKISEYFNSASDGSQTAEVIIKNDGTSAGVIELDIVLSMAEYDKASSFSADVIDDIIEAGQVPSWSNAILGEKNNGGTLTFDFTKSCSVAIYGASGSGKGIMTSALLSNAIADGCEVFYFDGKPDNGAALAKVVWDNDAGDAAVFNGCTGGSDTFQDYLENFSHGVRSTALRDNIIANIPYLEDNANWPFNDDRARQQLYEASITLKAFQFVHDMVLARTQNENVEMLPNGKKRWAVFVIDEIQDAASTESIVRKLMTDYMEIAGEVEVYTTETKTDSKGNTTNQQKRAGKIKDSKNWAKDTGYLFCKKWLAWAESRCIQWSNVVTKSLRNSSSTLITIFQSNKWLNQSGAVSTGSTKIGKLMLQVAQKTTKIVGSGSLIASNQWGDETSYAFSPEIAKGKWAIAKGESGLSDDATVYKPFKVFTTDLGANQLVPIDDRGAGADNCWKSKDDHSGKKPLGLQAYLRYLFTGLQGELAQQVENGERLPITVTEQGVLTSSLEYFDSVIKKRLDPQGIMHYMYDVDVISNFDGAASESEINAIEAAEKGESTLDDLNAGLNNVGVEEPVKTPTNTSQNMNPMGQAQSQSQATQGNQPLSFTSTKNLIVKDYDDVTLAQYFSRFIINNVQKNRFDYTDRKSKKGGLWVAAIAMSSLYYCSAIRGIYDLNEYVRYAFQKINNNQDQNNNFKFALGMLEAYRDETLDFDAMPTEEQMQQWLYKYIKLDSPSQSAQDNTAFSQSGNSFDTEEFINLGNDEEEEIPVGQFYDTSDTQQQQYTQQQYTQEQSSEQEFYRQYRECEEDTPVTRPSFNTSAYHGNDSRVKFDNPRSTQDVLILTQDMFVPVEVKKYEGIERFKKKLFESRNGTAYEFKKRWDIVLDMIAHKYPNKNMVNKIAIAGTQITVNGNPILLDGALGGDYNIQISDIIRIKDTFKKFPMIQYLVLDHPATQQLQREYGRDAQKLWRLFQENRALRTLGLIPSNASDVVNFHRENFANTTNALNELLGNSDFSAAMEQACAQVNPRLHEKAPGYLHSVYENGKSISGKAFQSAGKNLFNDKDPKVGRALGYSILGLGAIGVGAIFGVSGKLLEFLTPRRK